MLFSIGRDLQLPNHQYLSRKQDSAPIGQLKTNELTKAVQDESCHGGCWESWRLQAAKTTKAYRSVAGNGRKSCLQELKLNTGPKSIPVSSPSLQPPASAFHWPNHMEPTNRDLLVILQSQLSEGQGGKGRAQPAEDRKQQAAESQCLAWRFS